MNIRSLYPVPVAPQRSEISLAGHESGPSDDADRPRLRIVRDRVVISYRARELLDEMRQMPEVDMIIKTLLGTAPLTDERADEVLERIHYGYYNQPEVVKEVAGVLSSVFENEP